MKKYDYKQLSRRIKTGIWASYISAFMLVSIGIFWLVFPMAAEGSFSITPDTNSAVSFAKLVAIFKAICDFLPAVFVILTIRQGQFKLAGQFQLVTLVLVILVDMWVWASFVPNATIMDEAQHIPFAIPVAIAAFSFLQNSSKNN